MKYQDTGWRKWWEQRKAEIAAANAAINGVLPPWPRPWFLTDELEVMIAREISERPLHGVPASYTTESRSVARIMIERAAGKLIAHKRSDCDAAV
jgi:hypothetical protein